MGSDIVARGMAAGASAAATIAGSANTQSNVVLRSVVLGRGAGMSFTAIPAAQAPTVVQSTTAMSGATAIYGISSAGVLNTTNFRYSGAPVAKLAYRANAYPQYNVLTGANATADTGGMPPLTTEFFYSGAGTFDILRYGDGGDISLYINDLFVGRYRPTVTSGTAQAGTATNLTLATGASATNGWYNEYYLTINGGTGTGQTRRITAYVGSTKVATVDSAWATTPDATSTYLVTDAPNGVPQNGNDGSIRYLNITLPASVPARLDPVRVKLVGNAFYGVNIAATDKVFADASTRQMQCVIVGDSIPAGTAAPQSYPDMSTQIADGLGMTLTNLASGGTGWINRGTMSGTVLSRLTFMNRIAPPAEAWRIRTPQQISSSNSGTFTISITYNGVTSTTTALAWNASQVTIENALNALVFGSFSASSGVATVLSNWAQGCFCVARGDINTNWIVVANGMVGATISVNDSGLGTAGMTVTSYLGDVAASVPHDSSGAALPFLLLVVGSGNDFGATGYNATALQTAATYTAQQIAIRFPTAIPIFLGKISVQDGTSANGVVNAADMAYNAAIAAAAASLQRKLGNNLPYVDTYPGGLGSNSWINGSGTVASPTTGTTYFDVMKSIVASGHPTGRGTVRYATQMVGGIRALLA